MWLCTTALVHDSCTIVPLSMGTRFTIFAEGGPNPKGGDNLNQNIKSKTPNNKSFLKNDQHTVTYVPTHDVCVHRRYRPRDYIYTRVRPVACARTYVPIHSCVPSRCSHYLPATLPTLTGKGGIRPDFPVFGYSVFQYRGFRIG